MAELTDIREWARRSGHDIGDRGRIPADIRRAYEADLGASAAAGGDFVAVPDPEDSPDPTTGTPGSTPSAPTDETPPKRAARKQFWRKGGEPGPRNTGRDRRRKPVDRICARGWKALANLVGNPVTPVGRVMALQAPVAGVLLDDTLRGTIIDRILQPLARGEEKAEKTFALFGPPVLVTLMTSSPQLYQPLYPVLYEALESWVTIAGPLMKAAREREEKLLAAMGEDALDIHAMIAALFAGPPDLADKEPANAAA